MTNNNLMSNDFSLERQCILQNAQTLVIKLGSNVLADASGISFPIISNLAEQLVKILKDNAQRRLILVSSGAVATGRSILKKNQQDFEQNNLVAKQALAALGQGHLIRLWNVAFKRRGFLSAQILLTRDDLRLRNRSENIHNTLTQLLDQQIIPIINENDSVTTQGVKFGDNDSLASLLANLVEADLCVNVTSAPGVYAENPDQVANPTVLEYIEDVFQLDIQALCGEKTASGTGGMYSKLLAARRAAQIGIPTLILPGKVKNSLEKVFLTSNSALNSDSNANEVNLGTLIFATKKAIPRRKFWLAYKDDPAGKIWVDAGAMTALLEKGSSLLPGGIYQVQGDFAKGSLVRILFKEATEQERLLGVGLVNYDSATLKNIMRHKRHEIAAILGDADYPEAIHRDNLLLEAAVAELDS